MFHIHGFFHLPNHRHRPHHLYKNIFLFRVSLHLTFRLHNKLHLHSKSDPNHHLLNYSHHLSFGNFLTAILTLNLLYFNTDQCIYFPLVNLQFLVSPKFSDIITPIQIILILDVHPLLSLLDSIIHQKSYP